MPLFSQEDFLQALPFGYALHRLEYDQNGLAVDCTFLRINKRFSELLDMPEEAIVGHSVKATLPKIENDQFDWIGVFGRLAKVGGAEQIEQFSHLFNRWLRVTAFSKGDGHLFTLFEDITEQKKTASTN